MTVNVGGIDRVLRIIVGLGLIAFALFGSHAYAVWGWVGLLPLLTGIIRWCPAYMPFGVKSCKTD